MNTFIELFRKELLEIACLTDNTVGIYLKALYAYADYAKSVLHIKLVDSKARHLHKWLYCLKTKNKGYNFIKDSKVALNKFFAFLVKTGHRESNPADKLPRVKVPKSTLNKPLATHTLVKPPLRNYNWDSTNVEYCSIHSTKQHGWVCGTLPLLPCSGLWASGSKNCVL
jgi:site-specific recombinase XerD